MRGKPALALFGAKPRFAEPVVSFRPNFPRRERFFELAGGVFESGRLSNDGPLVRRFEDEVRAHTGVEHCLAVSSATMGLVIAAQALGLRGEVILPSWTFVATPHSLRCLGLDVRFADVDPETHGIDVAHAESLIGPRTAALLGVHLWGRPCAPEALEQLGQRHRIPVFFDAAHAFGNRYGGKGVGNFGALEVFSFHATKFVSTAEGGAIVTNDAALARRIRRLRAFGLEQGASVEAGLNAKMSELNAAWGLSVLEDIDDIIETNRLLYETYREGLKGIPGVRLFPFAAGERSHYHYVVLESAPEESGLDADAMKQVLGAENVIAQRYFVPPCHRSLPYRDAALSLPVTEALSAKTLLLPTGTTVRSQDVRVICEILRTAVDAASEIRAALEPSAA